MTECSSSFSAKPIVNSVAIVNLSFPSDLIARNG